MINRHRLYFYSIFPTVLLAVAATLFVFAIPVHAATITVDSTAQEVPFDNNGNCTLGEAIMAAETDSMVDGCIAGSGDDTISVPAGTYNLTAAHGVCFTINSADSSCAFPTINSKMTIQGAGLQNTIITRIGAAPQFRHLYLNSDADLTLRNLTLANGLLSVNDPVNTGGSTLIRGTAKLTTSGVRFENNTSGHLGGAVASWEGTAQINLTNSEFDGNAGGGGGGAIYRGHVTSLNSRFSNNQATTGGAIAIPLSLSVTSGSFSDNTAGNRGGGIDTCRNAIITNVDFVGNHAPFGGGVGIHDCPGQPSANVTVLNSDFISNTATSRGAGLYADTATITMTNSTLIENHAVSAGGFDGGGAMHLFDSLVFADQLLVQGNSATKGGGIDVYRSGLSIKRSALIDNEATTGAGAALHLRLNGAMTIENSTISNNSSALGGSVASTGNGGAISIWHSTITDNNSGNGTGGFFDGNSVATTHFIQKSILAGNNNASGHGDFQLSNTGVAKTLQSDGYTIIGAVGSVGNYSPDVGDSSGTIATPVSADIHDLQRPQRHVVTSPYGWRTCDGCDSVWAERLWLDICD